MVASSVCPQPVVACGAPGFRRPGDGRQPDGSGATSLPLGKLADADIRPFAGYRRTMNDAARTLYLVCYDVCDSAVRRRVQKYLTGFKVGGQKSFFECWLTAAELREVRATLADLIDLAEDRAHIFQLDPRMQRTLLGRATEAVTDVFLIV
jgi:CRISPR-associated protein Cas2